MRITFSKAMGLTIKTWPLWLCAGKTVPANADTLTKRESMVTDRPAPKTKATKMHTTKNDLSQNIRAEMIKLLNDRLADVVDLSAQLKQAHWTVRGPQFIALHELFDKVHTEAEAFMDMIAERVATLGGQAQGTVQVAASRSSLPQYPVSITSGPEHIEAVATVLAAFARKSREAIQSAADIGDLVTSDLFTEVTRGIDQQTWLVEAHAGR